MDYRSSDSTKLDIILAVLLILLMGFFAQRDSLNECAILQTDNEERDEE